MITLEEYKEILANHFIHNQDNNLIKLNERKKYLSEHYSDEYLNKIISDTYQFIEDVLNNEMIEKDYFSMSLSNNPIGDIFLNLVGGWNSDTLYFDSCGRIISNRILKSVFGLHTSSMRGKATRHAPLGRLPSAPLANVHDSRHATLKRRFNVGKALRQQRVPRENLERLVSKAV